MYRNASEIDNVSPVCDSRQVRILCGEPGNHSWRLYRSILRIESHRRKLTLREAFLLWIVAGLYRNGNRKVTCAIAYQAAKEFLTTNPGAPQAIALFAGFEHLEGDRLVDVVEFMTGKRVSERTIYRKCRKKGVPTYSRTGNYSAEQVRRVISAVAS